MFKPKAGQHAKAVDHYTSAVQLFPNPRAHFGRGTCLAALRRREEAADALQAALELSPGMVAAHVNLAGV